MLRCYMESKRNQLRSAMDPGGLMAVECAMNGSKACKIVSSTFSGDSDMHVT